MIYAISQQSQQNLPDPWKLEQYLPQMAEISLDIVNDAGRLNQFHGELRKTNPIYEFRGIFSASKQRIQAIFTTVAVNFKRYFYTNGRNFTQYLQ
jgi:hypothetical protein